MTGAGARVPIVSARLQLGVVACLVIAALWISPLAIFSDSVSGFFVLRSMERGAAWNHQLVVDDADISRDASEFVSWWTPGQYAVPMLFRPLGLDLGQCMLVTTLLAGLAGLEGYRRLFARWQLSPAVALPSLAILASQPYVLAWASFYHGGELLQWSWFPWCLLILLRGRALRWQALPGAAAALLLGLFFKSSFAIVAAAALAALAVLRLADDRFAPTRALLGWGMRAVVVTLAAALPFAAYVAAGRSPANPPALRASAEAGHELLFAMAAPLATLFDAWRLFVPESEAVVWPFTGLFWPLLLVAAATLALLGLLLRRVELASEYRIVLVTGYLVFVAAYALAYALELAISFNVRHYRLAGLLFVPGLVAAVAQLRGRALRLAGAAVLAAGCLASAALFARSVAQPRSERVVGREGFAQIYAGREVIEMLQRLDDELATGNNLIGVPWPQLGFEVARNRVLDMRTSVDGPEAFAATARHGRVDALVVLLPIELVRERRTKPVLDAFVDHRGWQRIYPETPDYFVMRSNGTAAAPP